MVEKLWGSGESKMWLSDVCEILGSTGWELRIYLFFLEFTGPEGIALEFE
jgi:hypothetical protein